MSLEPFNFVYNKSFERKNHTDEVLEMMVMSSGSSREWWRVVRIFGSSLKEASPKSTPLRGPKMGEFGTHPSSLTYKQRIDSLYKNIPITHACHVPPKLMTLIPILQILLCFNIFLFVFMCVFCVFFFSFYDTSFQKTF